LFYIGFVDTGGFDMNKTRFSSIAGALALATAGLAHAAPSTIIGGSALLDASSHAQIERWLGAGPFTLRKLYAKEPGASSAAFHAAADGKGPTLVVMEVTNADGMAYTVGGYNPQSWSSDDGWHLTDHDSQRVGFLFNLTAPAVYRQVLSDYVLPSQGVRQTFNGLEYGPTFGTGHDLYVNRTLDVAFSWRVTYGDPAGEGRSIIDGSTGGQTVRVNALEVFAVSPVPEAPPVAMLVGGLALVGLFVQRRAAARANHPDGRT
jgi:hypothetical protein